MPLDSQHFRVAKRFKPQQILSTIASITVQSISSIILPSLFDYQPIPIRTSALTGREYVDEVLNCKNPRRCQEVLRMKLEVFHFLCSELKSKGRLTPSRHITVEEQIAMFLYTVARAASNRDVQERFQHSGETVSRHFHAVLNAINRLVPDYIKLLNPTEIPTTISSNSKFYNFFNDCIGALDGTHIAAKVPEVKAAAFRNRKGQLSQNVLACCEFDNSLFIYVLAGWEGSAHDGAVLEAAFDAEFKVPTGKYYLGDAGYGLTPWCITPYRGTRYHLHEWSKSNNRYSSVSAIYLL